jgi:hypothetical protein
MNRRNFLTTTSSGFGYLALQALAQAEATALAPKQTHFAARAKHVIFLCMQGGPSHLDMLDYKPKLVTDTGKSAPAAAGGRGQAPLLRSPWKFKQHGRSGLWISELLPQLSTQADELCLLRSMYTDVPAHPQAFAQMHTGSSQFIRPSLGSWSLYGLGTLNSNMPGFIALNSPVNAGRAYGNAFLPAVYQGTKIGASRGGLGMRRMAGVGETGLNNVSNPRLKLEAQRTQLDFIHALNQAQLKEHNDAHTEMEGLIDSYELAFRMQTEIPQVMSIEKESATTKALYGVGKEPTDAFGKQCLMARKLIEAGVRFVEVNHGNWDHHRNLKNSLENNCAEIDLPISGLLTDLKQRDMLKDTLVIWGGEFGRTPHSQGADGRDHNNKGFTMFMAGGGVKGGFSYGATDEYGYEAVENRMHIHDWHATVLALLGLDHEKLTYKYAGRDFRLTDVYGSVAKEIFA